ncbi:MAG: hypothetical protein WD827_06655 [Solirubrobacterales bacterium]
MPEDQQGPAVVAERSTVSPPAWELVVMISGAVVLIGSFFPFLSIAGGELGEGAPGLDWNAWSNALNLFPLTALLVLYAVAVSGQLVLARYANFKLPDRIVGFTWADLRLLFGVLATLTMLGYLLREFPEGGVDKGFGLYAVTLGAIGLLVGAVMEHRDNRLPSASHQEKTGPPSQGDIAILVAGGVMLLGSFLTVLSGDGEGINAWHEGLIPLYLVPVALGLAMAAHIALTTFGSIRIPDRILGIEWNEVHRGFGIHAALMMLAFWVGNFFFTVADESVPNPDKGVGFWLMLIAALGLAAGAILRTREPSVTPTVER